jgi:hypothetical protein
MDVAVGFPRQRAVGSARKRDVLRRQTGPGQLATEGRVVVVTGAASRGVCLAPRSQSGDMLTIFGGSTLDAERFLSVSSALLQR